MAFDPDGGRLVTGGMDNVAIVWEIATAARLANLVGHRGWVLGSRFSPDGRLVATASADGTARLWDATSGRQIAVLEGHRDRGQ